MNTIKGVVTHPLTKYAGSCAVFLTGLYCLVRSAAEVGAWGERNK